MLSVDPSKTSSLPNDAAVSCPRRNAKTCTKSVPEASESLFMVHMAASTPRLAVYEVLKYAQDNGKDDAASCRSNGRVMRASWTDTHTRSDETEDALRRVVTGLLF